VNARVGAPHRQVLPEPFFDLALAIFETDEVERRSRIYTDLRYLSAIRIGGGTMTNLYTNPQGDVSDGIRHVPVQSVLQDEMLRYQNILKQYPPSSKMGLELPH